jgi:inactivated superfamily I helicase
MDTTTLFSLALRHALRDDVLPPLRKVWRRVYPAIANVKARDSGGVKCRAKEAAENV